MKKILSAVLLVCLFGLFPSGARAAPGDSPNDPIVVTTAAQLDAVRNGLNKYYKLGGNIDLTSYLASGGAGYAKWNTSGWMPIGTTPAAFTGGFDGAGYKITGLWINRNSMDYVGLFGFTREAVINKLGVEISAVGVKGYYYVGGLAGELYNGSITNCYVTGNVSGASGVGGLVGEQYAYNGDCSITNCYAKGNVNGSYETGGLVGNQFSSYSGSNIIINCYATSNINGSYDVGGLVGVQFGGSGSNTVMNCYATGNASGSSNVGGLAGEQHAFSGSSNNITNCYAAGNISGNNYAGGVAGRQYSNGGINAITNSYRYQLSTINGMVRAENTPLGIHGGIVTESQLKTQSTYTNNNWVFSAAAWYWDTRGFPKLNMGTENVPFSFATAPGDSPNNPIIVTTAAQLDAVRNGLNKYYKLGGNIDLTSYLASGGAGYTKWGSAGWQPVGTFSAPFAGEFDGAGYKISGLYINGSNIEYASLFGNAREATFRNLGIEISTAEVKGWNNVSGLAGSLRNGSVINCYVTGNVSGGGSSIGGLVGNSYDSSFTNCYTTGNASSSGSNYVGGIVGDFNNGSITNCYAAGNISGYSSVGGLVGQQYSIGSYTIINSYATGNVSGYSYVGGLVGSQLASIVNSCAILNCYATGNVSGNSNVGGIVGYQYAFGSTIITNCYRYQYATVNGVIRAENTPLGIHGGIVTESQLKTQSTYTNNNWVFSAAAWHWDTRGFPKLNMGTENVPFSFTGAPGDSPNNPIIVTTAAQLDAVRNGLNKYYKLGGNIDLTSYLASGGAGYAKWNTSGWMPIGTTPAAFTGGFDGAGYKITGLWINRNSMDYVGLFGFTREAVINKLGVEISAVGVKGYYYVGGLAGELYNGSITNCYITGNVSGASGVGGLVGEQYAYNGDCSITNCYAKGNVNGSYETGGLVGNQFSSYSGGNIIINCYATSNINGSYDVGGLVGVQFGGSGSNTVMNCYATGNASGYSYVGGVAGEQHAFSGSSNNITNCYAAGNISGNNYAGGVAGRQYSNGGINAITNSYRYQLSTINGMVRAENTPLGIHGGIVTESQLKTQSTYSNNKWVFSAAAWYWDTRGFPKLNMGTENVPFSFTGAPGDSPNNPIIVTTAAQLDAVRNGLNKYYKLGGNIDLTSYLASGGAGYTKWGSAGWQPFGTFTGSFDGAGYKITGLWINRSSMSYIGLFGYTNGATISNLGVEISPAGVKGNSFTGGLAGWLIHGNITNCYATGNVSGSIYVGGLVGEQYNYSGVSSAITNCYAAGNVSGTTYVGGLAGDQYSSSNNSKNTITNCYATGNVNGSQYVGGLVGWQYSNSGSSNAITNCYAAGNASGGNYAGGLIGEQYSYSSSNSIISSYAAGNVNGGNAGGVAGRQYSIGGANSITSCYRYQYATVNGAARTENTPLGVHGGIATAAQLKTQSTYTNNKWIFSTSAWYWDSRGFPKLNMGVENSPFRF